MSIKLLWSSFFLDKQKKKQLKERLQYAMAQNKTGRSLRKDREL